MNPLTNVVQSEYYGLQGTPSSEYREPQEMEPGSMVVCSKTLIKDYAHSWTLKGSRVFDKVHVCEYAQGTLRIEGDIRASFIKDNFEFFKTEVIPLFGEFGSTFFSGQINSGVPKPVKEIRGRAEALLNVVCKVEGLAKGSFQFMLDQFINKKGDSEDVAIAVIINALNLIHL